MNEKQQQLTFEKGMTTVPSDALCSDNALEEVTGLTFRDSEHHVIQKPVAKAGTGNRKLLFVHKLANGVENYIFEILNDADNNLWLWCNNQSDTYFIENIPHGLAISPKDVTAVGKTLVVNMDGKLRYFVWQGEYYKALSDLPTLTIHPTLINGKTVKEKGEPGNAIHMSGASGLKKPYINNQEDYNNFVIGLYAKTLKTIDQKKGFAKPFFVRAALELYDGTYSMITDPILLWPTIDGGTWAECFFGDMHGGYFDCARCDLYTFFYELQITQSTDYTEFSDIVKDVVIFASDGINVYDTGVDQKVGLSGTDDQSHAISMFSPTSSDSARCVYHSETFPSRAKDMWQMLTKRDHGDLVSDIKTTSVFYKLCTLGLRSVTDLNLTERIGTHTLENLTTQDQLDHDDYYSHCQLSAKMIYMYNNRLNIAGVERSFFNGYRMFMPLEDAQEVSYDYTIYVSIKAEGGMRVVKDEFSSRQLIGPYFYYPDPRADRVTVFRNGSQQVLNTKLTEHPGLNGAYFYNEAFDGVFQYYDDGGPALTSTDINTDPESLGGQLLQSEVNNPFTFLASGYHQVGNGSIIGMAAMTTALSQGQFGQYPLMVFTTEGIWGMSVNSTGLYTAAHPMSREVALKDNPCITQTDGAVFFVSKKGLMVVVGNDVKCCSEQLNGKSKGVNYQNVLAASDLHIAYDYRDSLLWLFSRSLLQNRALVYAIKSGTFAWCNCGFIEERVVNNYPDYLIQGSDDGFNLLYTLYWRPNANSDTLTYDAHIVTRPMKLENALALKSILEVRHIHSIGSGYAASLAFRIFASNNLQEWVQLDSLRGTPWKYYRFEYTFNNLKANDTFDGTVLITQERRTNKLR